MAQAESHQDLEAENRVHRETHQIAEHFQEIWVAEETFLRLEISCKT